jgi:hypothetical protein
MKFKTPKNSIKIVISCLIIAISFSGYSQDSTSVVKQKSEFWKKVRFGAGLGLNIGNNATNITIAPSAVYQFNNYVSAGLGLQGSYVSFKDSYKSYIYGGSLITLINPIEQVQLSFELEQLRVNTNFESNLFITSRSTWNTALFVGAGYVTNHVTLGIRYNVLFKESDNVYGDAFMPFVRVYF